MSRRSKKFNPRSVPPLDDDRVYPVSYFCEEFLGLSTDTFRRLCQRGEGPTITRLSATRIGIRGKHGKIWLDSRAKAPA